MHEHITTLLTQKISEGQTLAALYITAFTVYMTVSGAVLKFTMDAIKDGNSAVKRLLSQVGIGTSVVYFLACIFQWIVGQQLSTDIQHLNTLLGSPLQSPQMLILRFMSITSASFTVFAFFGWIFLLRRVKVSSKNDTAPGGG